MPEAIADALAIMSRMLRQPWASDAERVAARVKLAALSDDSRRIERAWNEMKREAEEHELRQAGHIGEAA